MKLANKYLSLIEATMKSSTGKMFGIPTGKWKHIKKSPEWEKNNDNDAKGKIGTFRKDGSYLQWQSDDAKASISIDAKEVHGSGNSLKFTSKGGLESWFEKED